MNELEMRQIAAGIASGEMWAYDAYKAVTDPVYALRSLLSKPRREPDVLFDGAIWWDPETGKHYVYSAQAERPLLVSETDAMTDDELATLERVLVRRGAKVEQ